MPQRVYIETSIPSYLTAWRSPELSMAARQQTTRQWWDERRRSRHGLLAHLELHAYCQCDVPAYQPDEPDVGSPSRAAARFPSFVLFGHSSFSRLARPRGLSVTLTQKTTMIVTHVSYSMLVFASAIHVLTAGGLSVLLAGIARVGMVYVFPFVYLGLIGMTAYLVFRNGRWAVDDEFIYKGWPLRPLVKTSEIEHAQIGLPDNILTVLSQIPGAGSLRAAVAAQQGALLICFSGNRWLIWEFWGMVNRQEFVERVLTMSPRDSNMEITPDVLRRLSLINTGRIIHGTQEICTF